MQLFKFEPILKQTIWGGERIIPFKGLDVSLDNVGESWELSGVPGDESIVAEGEHKGMSLPRLIGKYKEEIVGEDNYNRYGYHFPLLIKFIDAEDNLSVQVHPDDELAQERHECPGKTEMWYVMDHKPNAKLLVGLNEEIDVNEYRQRVKDKKFIDLVQPYEVKKGDIFYLPAGRVHAIGAGCFVAEIQQTSNITYRIDDYDRRDKEGHPRELHTELAADAIDFTVYPDCRTKYEAKKDEPVEVVACPHFVTSVYDLTEEMTCDYSSLDSFVIYVCLSGGASLFTEDGEEYSMEYGETILIPAVNESIKIVPDEGGVKFLETYV